MIDCTVPTGQFTTVRDAAGRVRDVVPEKHGTPTVDRTIPGLSH